MQKYYSGQGIFSVSERDADGKPLGFIDIGNVPEATVDIEIEKDEHKESRTGQRATDVTVITSKKGRLAMTVENFEQSILALGLHGSNSIVASATITDEVVILTSATPNAVEVPKFSDVDAVVVKDPTGTTTYVKDTDYTIDGDWGTLKGISTADGGSIPEGEKCLVTYEHDDVAKLEVFDSSAPIRWVRFHGVNTVDDLGKKVVNIFKVEFDPIAGYSLISDEIQGLELNGDILYDDTRTSGSPFMNEFDLAVQSV